MDAQDIKEWGTYCKVLRKYGDKAQMDILTEECAELIQANSKLHRARGGKEDAEVALQNFLEELADVQIMSEQMLVMCENNWGNAFKIFSKKKQDKIDRLSKRVVRVK